MSWNPIGDAARKVVERLIDARTRDAIENLVLFLESLERENFENSSGDWRRDHIYNSVIVVRDWLKRIERRVA
jgi:hypothetical protein